MATESLEQQALNRAARMYASFGREANRRPAPEQPNRAAAHPNHPVEEPSAKPAAPPEEKPKEPPREATDAPKGLLDALMEDKQQSLLLLLTVILMKDGADLNLILALMYLLI